MTDGVGPHFQLLGCPGWPPTAYIVALGADPRLPRLPRHQSQPHWLQKPLSSPLSGRVMPDNAHYQAPKGPKWQVGGGGWNRFHAETRGLNPGQTTVCGPAGWDWGAGRGARGAVSWREGREGREGRCIVYQSPRFAAFMLCYIITWGLDVAGDIIGDKARLRSPYEAPVGPALAFPPPIRLQRRGGMQPEGGGALAERLAAPKRRYAPPPRRDRRDASRIDPFPIF